MTCNEFENLLTPMLDGELSSDDRGHVDAHRSECPACQAAFDVQMAQHAELMRAFAPRRRAGRAVAERVIAQLPRRSSRRIPWLAMLVSAAAGFAIAFGIFGRHEKRVAVQTASQPAPIARLALATGAVEFRCPGDAQWCAMVTGGNVVAGTLVRTGPNVRCELQTTDGSEIRLNAATEVELKSPRQFELNRGQVWSSVARQPTAFEARASGVLFTALGTQFDLNAQAQTAVLTVVEGSVRASGAEAQSVLQSGEQMTVAQGRLGDKSAVHDLALATRWVNEILVLKGRDDPELIKRIDDLFAQIGQQKMSFMFEEEIRALGDHSVIPLTKYIESPRSKDDPQKRAIAARIVSDVAPPWAIPNLIGLLQDADGQVRYYAATGLQRLTGQSLGRSAEQWRTDELFACQPTATRWRDWWRENHGKFPGATPELPAEKDAPVAKQPAPLLKG